MQISIVVVVDVVATLKEKSIVNNAYLIDNTQDFSCKNVSNESMATQVPGVCNPNGSQAAEAVLNWITMSIAALPTTLPRNYAYRNFAKESDAQPVHAMKSTRTENKVRKSSGKHDAPLDTPPTVFFEQTDGSTQTMDIPLLDMMGKAVRDFDIEAAAYIPLQVNAIYGPAVKDGVMFPALYGSPDLKSQGWYWSASVDTSKEGQHTYYMDVVLHRPIADESKNSVVLAPEIFTITGQINVTQSMGVNGFTAHIGPALLPLPPIALTQTGEVI